MENILKENGTDDAVLAIQQYFVDGQLDEEWFVDDVELTLDNTERLINNVVNPRIKAHSIAYDAMLTMFLNNGYNLSSRQIQAGFKKLGLDYKEILKPVVEYINQERKDERIIEKPIEEDKETKSLEEFIQDLVNNFDNIDTSDLQGIVAARCMQTNENEDEILDELYNRIEKLNECLKNTDGIETLHEDEEVVTDDELELNLDNEVEPSEIDMEPRQLDIEEIEEGETGTTEENITTEINDANQEVNVELEQNDYTIGELINGVKTLIDAEKESITMCNEFLANFAAKTPKEVYEIIESYINDIKNGKLDEQTKLNNLFDALNSYATTDEPIDREDELVDEEPEIEEPIIAVDDDEIFNALAEEGKLVVTNFNTLAEQYANCKGIENTNKLKLEMRKSLLNNYKIIEDKEYTFVSKELIENKLLAEEKKVEQAKELEKVKKEAEQNAKETGEDTYVYQSVLDGTMFFATQKPTHTALFNKVLVLGKYKVSIEKGEIYTTWLKESKQEYKYKKSLTEDTGMVPNVPDGKEVESPVSGNRIVNEATPTYLFKAGEINRGEYDKLADHNSPEYKYINHEISFGEYEKLADKNSPDYKYLANEINMGEYEKLNESKEDREIIEEIDKDYEKITIDEFKKRNKEYIDLVYKNTWGEEIDKDLYDDIVKTMYDDSITGNIDTKANYESLSTKIENVDIDTINDEVKNK